MSCEIDYIGSNGGRSNTKTFFRDVAFGMNPRGAHAMRPATKILPLLLFGHTYFQLGRDLTMQLHRRCELAKRLERFVEMNPLSVDLEAFGRQRFGDIGSRHRAIQL